MAQYTRPRTSIKQGTAIQVNIIAENMEDERIFTNHRKLLSYLYFIKKNNSTYKVKMKTRHLNQTTMKPISPNLLWNEMNFLASEVYGEFGFATLPEDKMQEILKMALHTLSDQPSRVKHKN